MIMQRSLFEPKVTPGIRDTGHKGLMPGVKSESEPAVRLQERDYAKFLTGEIGVFGREVSSTCWELQHYACIVLCRGMYALCIIL